MEHNERITIDATKIIYAHEIGEHRTLDYSFNEITKEWHCPNSFATLKELPDGCYEKDGLYYKKATVVIHMEWAHRHTLHFERNDLMQIFMSNLNAARKAGDLLFDLTERKSKSWDRMTLYCEDNPEQ